MLPSRRIYMKAYREANKEKTKLYNKAYHKTHRAENNIQSKVYYEKHKEEIKAQKKAYRKANPESVRTSQKAWKELHGKAYKKANSQKIKAWHKAYHKINSEKKRDYNRKRRALKRATQVEVIKEKVVYLRDGWICQHCKKRVNKRFRYPHLMSASLDHIIPLNKGGTHTYTNVQLAHLGCNLSKHDRVLPQGEQMRWF